MCDEFTAEADALADTAALSRRDFAGLHCYGGPCEEVFRIARLQRIQPAPPLDGLGGTDSLKRTRDHTRGIYISRICREGGPRADHRALVIFFGQGLPRLRDLALRIPAVVATLHLRPAEVGGHCQDCDSPQNPVTGPSLGGLRFPGHIS